MYIFYYRVKIYKCVLVLIPQLPLKYSDVLIMLFLDGVLLLRRFVASSRKQKKLRHKINLAGYKALYMIDLPLCRNCHAMELNYSCDFMHHLLQDIIFVTRYLFYMHVYKSTVSTSLLIIQKSRNKIRKIKDKQLLVLYRYEFRNIC